MATTSNALVYPASTDAPNGPLQMQQLADSAKAVPGFISSGSTAVLSATTPVTTGLTPYVGLRVINYNTADPAEVRVYTCIDISPVRWIGNGWNDPWGRVGHDLSGSTDQTSISSLVDVTGVAVTITAVGNRYYVVKMRACAYQSTTAGVVHLAITDSANGLLGNCDQYETMPGVGSGFRRTFTVESNPFTMTAGTQTIKLRAGATSGGTLTIENSLVLSMVAVYDVGPAGVPI